MKLYRKQHAPTRHHMSNCIYLNYVADVGLHYKLSFQIQTATKYSIKVRNSVGRSVFIFFFFLVCSYVTVINFTSEPGVQKSAKQWEKFIFPNKLNNIQPRRNPSFGILHRNIPEDGILHSYCSENLKSYIIYTHFHKFLLMFWNYRTYFPLILNIQKGMKTNFGNYYLNIDVTAPQFIMLLIHSHYWPISLHTVRPLVCANCS
jgi:hypothetical protein